MLGFDDATTGRRIVALYRRPGTTISRDLLEALDSELQDGTNPLVLGDLNMNMLRPYPQPTQLRTQLKHQHSLAQWVKFVTRPPKGRRQTRGSLIDHVWSRESCRCTRLPALSQHSDHHAIRVQFGGLGRSEQQPVKRAWRRKWDEVDAESVAKILDEEMPERGMRASASLCDFVRTEAEAEMQREGVGCHRAPSSPPLPMNSGTPEEAAAVLDGWGRAWHRIKTELAPRVRVTVRKSQSNFPWVNDTVREAKRVCNQLFRAARTPEGKTAYHRAKRDAERVYKNARRDYIKAHWKKAGDVPFSREHWQFLNRLMGRKSKARVEPRCSPDAVNDAFVRKVERIRAPLLSEPHPDIHVPLGLPEFQHFRWVTGDEVLKELTKVKATSSAGTDDIPMKTRSSFIRWCGADTISCVFVGSGAMRLRRAHSSSCCSATSIAARACAGSLCEQTRVMSSAYATIRAAVTYSPTSALYSANASGPQTDPCGTPLSRLRHALVRPPDMRTRCLLPSKYDRMSANAGPRIPHCRSNFSSKIPWSMVSKAALQSADATYTVSPWSRADATISTNCITAVSQLRPGTNPCW
eukprot:gene57631-biopygen77886